MIRHLIFCFALLSIPQVIYADIYSASDALSRGDYDTAAGEFKRLADAGDARAQANLGYMYYVGEGVEQSYEKAVEWYRKAADQGDKDAQYNLAVAYAFGEGVQQDFKKAADWYRKAANQGHVLAQYSLGISYSFGEGVKQDSTEAVKWFRAAADQGYERAQVQLGSKYHTGDGVEQDYSQAAYWYRKAADRGDAAAQFNLGTLYRAGKGVEQDYNQAVRWFRLAADQGYAAAQNELASMERAISGAARSNTSPNLQPSPITRPAPIVRQAPSSSTAAAESTMSTEAATEREAAVAATTAKTTENDRTSEQATENTALFAVDSADLLTLDKQPESGNSGQPESGQPESKLLTPADGQTGSQPLDETKLLAAKNASAETGSPASDSTNEGTTAAPAVDTTRPRGFFSRLFGRHSGDSPDRDNEQVSEAANAGEDSTVTPEPEDAVAAEETATPPVDEDTAGEAAAEEKPKRSFFGRLFGGKSEEQQPAEAETMEPAETAATMEPVAEQPAAEAEDAVTAEETATPPVDENTAGEAAAEEKPKRSFFGRLFGGKSDSESGSEPDKVDAESVAATDEPVNTLDVDREPGTTREAMNTADSGSEQSVAEEKTEEQPKRGFFSKLFNRSDDNETAETTETAESTGADATESDVTAETASEPANTEDFQAALDSFNNKEYDEAYVLFRSLAVEGDPHAQYKLGTMYHQGLGVSKSYTDAIYWYQQAAKQGNVDAQYSLGNMYLMGEGIDQSDKQAAFWYEKAAAQGNKAARHNLENLKKVESETGSNVGKVIPGEVPADSEGFKKPEKEKKSHFAFIKNLFSKDDKAKEESRTETDSSTKPATTADETTSVEAAPGDTTAEASNAEPEKEHKSFFGRLFGKDEEEEKEPADTAEVKEEQKITPEQAEEVSKFLKSENSDKQEQAGADTAKVNNGKDDYDKGLKYQYGEGVQKDSTTAFQLFMKSAEQGYAPAQYKLGTAYAYGEGVDKDEKEAARWYNRAARQGYAIAQRNLGVMYLNGEGVEKNRSMAMAWYSVLAEAGNVMDIRRRDMLEEELSSQEKAEARRFKDEIMADIKNNNSEE